MKPVLQTLAALAVLGALGAAAVVGLGLYNVSARQGHLPGVATVLHTTFKQSVRLRAPAADVVPGNLDDPARIALGAQHYRTACAFCHALPGTPRNATAEAMNPPPPHISVVVSEWDPQHMFWIVREGVKMSGMPAWPATDRDDEIWSVVAYLEAIEDMTAQQQAVPTAAPPGRSACAGCHGEGGRSTNAFVPRLDILTHDEVAEALLQYRSGERPSGIMQEAVARLDDTAIAELAEKFGAPTRPDPRLPDGPDGPGRALATGGTLSVPACTACHGPGRQEGARAGPSIAGQSRHYLEAQLRLWREGTRGGGRRAELMRKAAKTLSDDDITSLAAWFASLDSAVQPED